MSGAFKNWSRNRRRSSLGQIAVLAFLGGHQCSSSCQWIGEKLKPKWLKEDSSSWAMEMLNQLEIKGFASQDSGANKNTWRITRLGIDYLCNL